MAASYSSADMDMLFKYHDDDPKAIISSLLDSLVEGSFQWPARVNTIRSPEHVRILCVVLLPRVPLSQQADVLGVFTQLLDNCRNASICAQVRLIEQLVALVQSPGWHEGASSEHAPPAHARHRRQRIWPRPVRHRLRAWHREGLYHPRGLRPLPDRTGR